jgi:hypothetical protein
LYWEVADSNVPAVAIRSSLKVRFQLVLFVKVVVAVLFGSVIPSLTSADDSVRSSKLVVKKYYQCRVVSHSAVVAVAVAADFVVVPLLLRRVSLDSTNVAVAAAVAVAVPADVVALTIAKPELAVDPVTAYTVVIVVREDLATAVAVLTTYYSSRWDPSFCNSLG